MRGLRPFQKESVTRIGDNLKLAARVQLTITTDWRIVRNCKVVRAPQYQHMSLVGANSSENLRVEIVAPWHALDCVSEVGAVCYTYTIHKHSFTSTYVYILHIQGRKSKSASWFLIAAWATLDSPSMKSFFHSWTWLSRPENIDVSKPLRQQQQNTLAHRRAGTGSINPAGESSTIQATLSGKALA